MKNFISNTRDQLVMRALSWKEPYGSLMLHGKIETRPNPTKVLLLDFRQGRPRYPTVSMEGQSGMVVCPGGNSG
jgi:hypothetical protein